MPRNPSLVEPGEVRNRIVDAALSLFARQGFFRTSVPDMARKARVSVGSIYHHFDDKEGVARELYRDLVANLQVELAQIEARHATAHDRCRAVVEMLFDLTERVPAAMEFMIYARHREFLPDEPPICSSAPFATMRRFVADGMDAGEVRRMAPMVAASCVYGGALRLIAARLDGILDEPLGTHLDVVWSASWQAVAA